MFKCGLCNFLKAVKRGVRKKKQIFYCGHCQKYFSKPLARINHNAHRIFLDHLEGISCRKLARRYGAGKNQLCRTVNELAKI